MKTLEIALKKEGSSTHLEPPHRKPTHMPPPHNTPKGGSGVTNSPSLMVIAQAVPRLAVTCGAPRLIEKTPRRSMDLQRIFLKRL